MGELESLFQKFDSDGSGSLDMDEITEMFKSVGILTDKTQIKKIFESAEDFIIKNNELDNQ